MTLGLTALGAVWMASATPSPSPSPSPTSHIPAPPATIDDSWPAWAQWLFGLPLRLIVTVVLGLIVIAISRRAIRSWSTAIANGRPWSRRTHWGRKLAETEVGSVLAEANPLTAGRRAQRARTVGSVMTSVVTAVIGLILVMMVLRDLGVDVAPLLASAGIVGIAIGFGAQSLVKDVLSGLFMLLEDQYGVGDVVDLGEASGTVEDVGLRVTKVRDVQGTLWFVPNGEILRVGNKTQGWGQAVVDIRIPYTEDVEQATGALMEAAQQVAADPEIAALMVDDPVVNGIEDLAAGSILLRMTVKTVPARQWDVARALRLRVTDVFAAQGIHMAPAVPPPAPAGK